MSKYDAKSMTISTTFEGIQMHPGQYIGSADINGLHHLLKEGISNSVDEFLNNHCSAIKVYYYDDHVSIVDDGRGIPVGTVVNPTTGKTLSALEACVTLLHAGGKGNNGSDGAAYRTAGGEHGTGLKCINALSDRFVVVTKPDEHSEGFGKMQTLVFVNGEKVEDKIEKNTSKEYGLSITFWPSPKYLEETRMDPDWIKAYLKEQSLLNQGLSFTFIDSSNNETVFLSQNGLYDYMQDLIGTDQVIIQPTMLNYEANGCKFNILLSYTNKYKPTYKLYTNNIPQESGSHLTGFKTTFTRVMNKFANDNNLLKAKDGGNLLGSDYEEGLNVILTLFMDGRPIYKGQHKEELNDTRAKNFVMEGLSITLENLCLNNPKLVKDIISRAVSARKARLSADKAKEIARGIKTKVAKAIDLPTKLVDAMPRNKDRSNCELYIVEGDSAGNGLISKRDGQTQGIMPLRGKILSVRKASVADMFKNQEIDNIVKALGLKVNPKDYTLEYDAKKLRYNKLIIATDADADGMAISNLLITLFWRLCPDLIMNGHLYVAVPPLYRITTKKNEYVFLTGDKELEAYKKAHKANDYTINRNKGLGEQSPDELAQCLLKPETRILMQLVANDFNKTDDTLEIFQGTDTERRKNYYIENWNNV